MIKEKFVAVPQADLGEGLKADIIGCHDHNMPERETDCLLRIESDTGDDIRFWRHEAEKLHAFLSAALGKEGEQSNG
jgi:hypothetical protein